LESHFELISYYTIVATAGHDTTRNAITGGLHALITNPEQLRKLQDDPNEDAIKLAVEEMIRWSTPVAQFSRTAQVDCEIRGKQIKKGDCLGLMYASNILTKRNLIILLVSTCHPSPIIIWLLVLARINVWVCC
jgi:cytochrome P450